MVGGGPVSAIRSRWRTFLTSLLWGREEVNLELFDPTAGISKRGSAGRNSCARPPGSRGVCPSLYEVSYREDGRGFRNRPGRCAPTGA